MKSTFKLALLLIAISSSQFAVSQAREAGSSRQPLNPTKKDNKFDLDRLVIGGGFGAQFGDITSVQLAPTLGYLFTDNLLAGLTGKYIYYQDREFNYETNMYGGGLFAQYFFLENFIAHAEYELLSLEAFNPIDFTEKRVTVNSVFVGGGYRSFMGGNSFVSIMLLYNLNDDINSPYTNPILRIGFGIGL
ncbi:MAG: hypothetical protein RJQ00_11520 [Vicingaceae bacterium]